MMFFFFYMLVIPASLIIGWVMQIVIATTGFFGKNAPFATHARRRGIAAAWTTSVATPTNPGVDERCWYNATTPDIEWSKASWAD